MISVVDLFEVGGPNDDRTSFANERIATLQRAFKSGRMKAPDYQAQLKQFMQMKRGVPSKQMPESEIKTAGTYLNSSPQ